MIKCLRLAPLHDEKSRPSRTFAAAEPVRIFALTTLRDSLQLAERSHASQQTLSWQVMTNVFDAKKRHITRGSWTEIIENMPTSNLCQVSITEERPLRL